MTFASHFCMAEERLGKSKIRNAYKKHTYALKLSENILGHAKVIEFRLYIGNHVVNDGAVDRRLIEGSNVIECTS